MSKIYFTILFFAFTGFAFAQTDTTSSPPEPLGGIERLALRYYDIEFTPEQRQLLKGVDVEMIYFVSDSGVARLESVNGILNRAIRDSLFSRTDDLPRFKPQMTRGIAKQSLYFMQMQFPEYIIRPQDPLYNSPMYLQKLEMDDFEFIELSEARLDMVIGGMVNTFIGSPADYLNTGGGMKLLLAATGENKMFYGMNMNFYGNKRKAQYDVKSTLEQYENPGTLFIGITAGRWFNPFSLQVDLNYAIQNITERKEDDDSEWIQFRGFSPGLIAHYPLQLGKDKLSVNALYGRPSFVAHYLSFSFGMRYMFMNHSAASGLMAEVGVSYRLTTKMVESYKIKDSFYER
ncbi:hypothetical protein G3O08_13425 [Cryomorpha ignava]|uniref:PorT family protein n=1 Tax=Cryomorpha ignava TaxID=101383 RepID=A0A7K3WSP6_9FLAO|nr:hypothetical protein [Cryomorpha ignava]NEN24504.1 hypothetical protein [Cryomorpha ignava]